MTRSTPDPRPSTSSRAGRSGRTTNDSGPLREPLPALRRAWAGDDGTVHVRVGATDDGLFDEDDGPGIPEAERETVLERGYSTSDSGTGFGLSIVGEIVEAHGWAIRVAASGTGGARFEISGVDTRAHGALE